MIGASVLELAAQATPAIRRQTVLDRITRELIAKARPKRAEVRVISMRCPICGQLHAMGLGSPRSTTPAPKPPFNPFR